MKTTDERFAEKYRVVPNGCWIWAAGFRKGHGLDYPILRVDGRTAYAHRYAYAREYGPIPAGMLVLHQCHDRRCVNPAHLRLGTHADNMADRTAAGNYVVRRGSTRALTTEDVAAMQRMRAAGMSTARIAQVAGVCLRTAQYVLAGHREGRPANDNARRAA